MKAETRWSKDVWFERGPVSAGVRRSWDTWRIGVRNVVSTLTLTTRRHWWTVEVILSKAPREKP